MIYNKDSRQQPQRQDTLRELINKEDVEKKVARVSRRLQVLKTPHCCSLTIRRRENEGTTNAIDTTHKKEESKTVIGKRSRKQLQEQTERRQGNRAQIKEQTKHRLKKAYFNQWKRNKIKRRHVGFNIRCGRRREETEAHIRTSGSKATNTFEKKKIRR